MYSRMNSASTSRPSGPNGERKGHRVVHERAGRVLLEPVLVQERSERARDLPVRESVRGIDVEHDRAQPEPDAEVACPPGRGRALGERRRRPVPRSSSRANRAMLFTCSAGSSDAANTSAGAAPMTVSSANPAPTEGFGLRTRIGEVARVLAQPGHDRDELGRVVAAQTGLGEDIGVEGLGGALDQFPRPDSVRTRSAARPSCGCGSRAIRPSRTSRSAVLVTVVGCTCSRATTLESGRLPARLRPAGAAPRSGRSSERRA